VPIARVAIVPSAPLLLPAASPGQPDGVAAGVAELRRDVGDAVGSLPEEGTALLLDSGAEALVHHAEFASLTGYGMPHVQAKVTIDAELLTAVSARGQAPRSRSDRLDGDTSVLALLLAGARPGLAIAPVTIPAGASAVGLGDIAVGLEAAIATVDHPVSVVAAGDLAATLSTSSPGYLVDGATGWDAEVVAAVRAQDAAAVGALGPAAAARVVARGWAPVTVALLLAAAAGIALERVTYAAPCGVGQLTAH